VYRVTLLWNTVFECRLPHTTGSRGQLDALVARIKEDRSILAVVLCGSLSHDTVLGQIRHRPSSGDDRRQENSLKKVLRFYADGNQRACAAHVPNRLSQGGLKAPFAVASFHSFPYKRTAALYARSQHCRTLRNDCIRLAERDIRIQLLNAAGNTLPAIYKAHKWFSHARRPSITRPFGFSMLQTGSPELKVLSGAATGGS